jgi:hypothetical protein
MDFIEQWFHVSPDNGNGATEIIYIIAVASLVVVLSCRRRISILVKWCRDRIPKIRR